MRFVSRKWSDLMEGDAVELIPDDSEDTWHLYNLIHPGDFFGGATTRKVKADAAGVGSSSGGGCGGDTGRGASSARITVNLTVVVTSTSYDPHSGLLRVTGRNATNSDDVPLGAYHSIDVHMHTVVRIGKAGGWDSVSEMMLLEAMSSERAGDGGIAAVVMDDRAAHICLITPNRTLLKVQVTAGGTRKPDGLKKKKATAGAAANKGGAATGGAAGGAKSNPIAAIRAAENPYFFKIITTFLRSFDFARPRPLIFASPGFTAGNLKTFLAEMATTEHDTKFFKAQARETTVVATRTGSLHGLNAVMNGPEMRTTMQDMRFAQESRYLDRFMEVSRFDDGRAHYGVKPVAKAVDAGAVGAGKGLLLMNNTLFRSTDLAERKMFVALADAVKAAGGEVRVISSEHESGKRLAMLGNVAAVLTFPMPELDDEGEDEEEEEERQRLEEERQQQAQARSEERQREGEVDDMVMGAFGNGSAAVY